jgi:hypothetical protein
MMMTRLIDVANEEAEIERCGENTASSNACIVG